MNKPILFFLALLISVTGCKEKFVSPAPAVITGFLVIEGVINNDGGTSNIKLSRTTGLADDKNIIEPGATVKVTDGNNGETMLFERTPGNYAGDNLHFDTTKKYRLSIKTNNNEEYLSDFVAARYNPPIDSVSWLRDDNGVHLYINTHDPQNNTHYYQWEYNETWEFHSPYSPTLKYILDPINGAVAGVIIRDSTDPKVATCWQSNASNLLLLGSTAKLSRDVIYLPLTEIGAGDWKLSVLYSIIVKQYSWTKEGYEFLERMKKNTESVGSVFDAQPSELNGNIHCISNPNQPAIGYFNICTVREQRIYINRNQLPGWNYQSGCRETVIENQRDSIAKKGTGLLAVTELEVGPFGRVITFYAAPAVCVDCTLKGTNVKPDFWP